MREKGRMYCREEKRVVTLEIMGKRINHKGDCRMIIGCQKNGT